MGGWWKVLSIISGAVYITLGTHFMPLKCVHLWVVKTINIALCIFYHERSVEGVNFQGDLTIKSNLTVSGEKTITKVYYKKKK